VNLCRHDVIQWKGYNAYLVKSNCELCMAIMVCRDLLFVSNSSDGFKINEIREFLNKKLLNKLFTLILRILNPDSAREHLDPCGR